MSQRRAEWKLESAIDQRAVEREIVGSGEIDQTFFQASREASISVLRSFSSVATIEVVIWIVTRSVTVLELLECGDSPHVDALVDLCLIKPTAVLRGTTGSFE